MIPDKLLEILCCPKCHGDLKPDPGMQNLTCQKCSAVYAIKNGIPILLSDDDTSSERGNDVRR